MHYKYTTFCLPLVLLATLPIYGQTNDQSAAAQTAKARAIEIQKQFAAFWTTESTQPVRIPPTLANVHYGADEKQVLDFWKTESDQPAPLVFFIHGGSWKSMDKNRVTAVSNYLAAGISVVSINYRFVQEAQAAGIKPPVEWPIHDAARALQFVRSKATEWKLDKTRIGVAGESAGACSSLWLAFHDDMADARSKDPVAHESTRVMCVGVVGAQTTLDPQQMREWTPNSIYGGHSFGFDDEKGKKGSGFQEFLKHRDEIMPWIRDYSPYELVTADDPPVFLYYTVVPALGKKQRDPTHSSNFGVKLQEKMRATGVECQLMYPGVTNLPYANPIEFLIGQLKAGKTTP